MMADAGAGYLHVIAVQDVNLSQIEVVDNNGRMTEIPIKLAGKFDFVALLERLSEARIIMDSGAQVGSVFRHFIKYFIHHL